MLRLERRTLIDSMAIGLALTLLVVAAEAWGVLGGLEAALYDLRARWCQQFVRPPTDRLVHLDIDDRALAEIGRWPWPRARVAEVIEELALARPKVVGLDLLLSDVSDVPADDEAMAGALSRLENVVLPIAFQRAGPASRLNDTIRDLLINDMELKEQEVVERLRPRLSAVELARVSKEFLDARKEAMYQRLRREMSGGEIARSELQRRILTRDPDVSSPVSRLLAEQYGRVMAERAAARLSMPVVTAFPETSTLTIQTAALPMFAKSARAEAFVDATFDRGVARSMPLFKRYDGRLYPQFSFAMACAMLGVGLDQVRIEGTRVVLPLHGGSEIRIPVSGPRADSASGEQAAVLMEIPWVGGREWENMYDWPRHRQTRQHESLMLALEPHLILVRMRKNNAQVDEALRALLSKLDPGKLDKFLKERFGPDDFAARASWIESTLSDARPIEEQYAKIRPEELTADDRIIVASIGAVRRIGTENAQLQRELREQRAKLAAAVGGRAVIVGWTATAAIADFVQTSLHVKCPGPVVHGAVLNGIMSGELWRRAPAWVVIVLTIVMGMTTAWVVGRLPPTRAALIAVSMIAGYAIINGVLVFDRGNVIVELGAPMLATAVVWSGGTLSRILAEAAERKRITKRFRSYVDPKLVNYLAENPDTARLEGEMREMTVCFTDMAGFTALSEKLGEQIVPVMNEFYGLLVPIIREKHRGYVNKFMGDGIMCFFGAPIFFADHAIDAVATVLDMQAAIPEFNRRLESRGLPPVAVRAGIGTGQMVVGDAGTGEASDYTVLGNVVNLASRLESANKVVGTSLLINELAAAAVRDRFVVRPIGRIRVKGQTTGVLCYDVLGEAGKVSDREEKLAEFSRCVVESFGKRDLQGCFKILDALDGEHGASKWSELYRSLCQQYEREMPDDFDGTISLTEK